MEKKYIVRPIEVLRNLDEIEDWEFPNQEMELFQYDVVYQSLEEYNKVLNDKKDKWLKIFLIRKLQYFQSPDFFPFGSTWYRSWLINLILYVTQNDTMLSKQYSVFYALKIESL